MNHVLGLSIASSTLLHPGPREHRAGPCLCEHPSDLLLQSKCLQSAFGREKLWGTARGVQEQQGNRSIVPGASRAPAVLDLSRAWAGNALSLWGGDCRELGPGRIRSALHYCTEHLGSRQAVTALCNAGKQAVLRADTGAAGGWRAGKWCGPSECGLPVEGGARSSCSSFACTWTMKRRGRQCLCCRNQYRSGSGRGAPPCAPGGAIPRRLSPSHRCSLASQRSGLHCAAPGMRSLLTWIARLLLEEEGIGRRDLV